MAFSASTLKVNTLYEVLLSALYAACVIGILLDNFWLVLFIIYMAIMMGIMFAGGPCGFPGLGMFLFC